MEGKRRKFAAAILALVFLMSGAGFGASRVYAFPFGQVPGHFWATLNPYTAAVNAGDSAGIVAHGRRVMEHWFGNVDVNERAEQWGANVAAYGGIINLMWSVANNVANHYERLGNRDGTLWALRVAYAFVGPYQSLMPDIVAGNPADMEFARIRLRNRIRALDVNISLFAELWDGSGETVFFGAPHEPETGVFFGEQPGLPTIADGPQLPSGLTIYVEFETEHLPSRVLYDLLTNELMHGLNRRDYSIIQIAWNFQREGHTPANVPNQRQKIVEAAQFLYGTNLPILLRVGGEVDVWTTEANPDEFIAAFRFIANIMRQYAPNVAMVYSVNSVSAHGLDWMTFYPGDDYVDWVGISLYTIRYFMGNPETSDVDAAIFRTGQYAYPIGFIRELVEEFGDRKPILISEGGVSLYNVRNSADLTEWALPRMRQVYSYIPMLFPQVKAIFWFNVHVPGGNQRYDFDLSPEALALYRQLTAQPHFIGRGGTSSNVTYREICGEGVTFPANAVVLLTYAPFFALDSILVEYRLNGAWLGSATDIPYRRVFNLSELADGEHVLRVAAIYDGRTLQAIEFLLEKDGDYVVISAK